MPRSRNFTTLLYISVSTIDESIQKLELKVYESNKSVNYELAS